MARKLIKQSLLPLPVYLIREHSHPSIDGRSPVQKSLRKTDDLAKTSVNSPLINQSSTFTAGGN